MGTIQVTQVIEAPGGLRMIWATGYFCDLQGTLKKRLGLWVITHGRAAPRGGEEVKTAKDEMPINTPRRAAATNRSLFAFGLGHASPKLLQRL
jgi:hypothetical protein